MQADITRFAKENRTAASRMWYTLKRAAVRIREDIADMVKARVQGENYDASVREARLALRYVQDMRDKFGKALREAKKSSAKSEGGFSFAGQSKQFNEATIEAALWEAFDHSDTGDDNLILVGQMPQYIVDKFGINGDIYIYRNHAYENMVSREDAIAAGRPTRRGGDDIHFHDLGIEKMTSALASINDPTMVWSTKNRHGNPTLIMILSEFGNNNVPLYAVLSFYDTNPINGDFSKRPHMVLTVAEREWFGTKDRSGYAEMIKSAVDDGRVLDFNKKRREDLSVIANPAGVGNITENSLKNSIARFRKEVKDFKEKNNISYSFSGNTGTRALTRAEAENRIKALRMFEDGKSAEEVYDATGWHYDNDNYGELVVDHEAPVYIGDKSAVEKAHHSANIANKRADIAEAESAKMRAELAAVREDAAKWQARAERAKSKFTKISLLFK